MISIYSLRPVCTFIYTIINDNVIAFFVQKNKSLRFYGSKRFFLRTYATWKPPSLSLYAIVRIWRDPSLPSLCIRAMWMTPKILEKFLFQIVYNELSPICFVRDIPQGFSFLFTCFFLIYLYKCCNLLSHNLFTSDRKCLKIIVFSKLDGLKINGSSIELGKK